MGRAPCLPEHNPRTLYSFYRTWGRGSRLSPDRYGRDQISRNAFGPVRAPEMACSENSSRRTGCYGSPILAELSDNAVQRNVSGGVKGRESGLRTEYGREHDLRRFQCRQCPKGREESTAWVKEARHLMTMNSGESDRPRRDMTRHGVLSGVDDPPPSQPLVHENWRKLPRGCAGPKWPPSTPWRQSLQCMQLPEQMSLPGPTTYQPNKECSLSCAGWRC